MDEIKGKKTDTPVSDVWVVRNHIQSIVLMAATVFGIYICYQMAMPFLSVLVWALTLAVLFSPLQCWLETKLKYASLAAIVSILLIALIVVAPAILVGQQLVLQAVSGAQLIETKVNSGEWRETIEAQPQLAPIFHKIEQHVDLPAALKTFTSWLGATAGEIVKGSIYQVLALCLVFYVLFFFLRDRHLALISVRALSPLTKSETSTLFDRVSDTIYATVYGTFAIAAVQGLLGGLVFWWLGLPAPLLWGLVMSFLAIIPMLGSSIIWAPAALFLALEGNWTSALILTFWGLLVISTIDNLLRPIFVGNRLKLHTILAFLSVLGGLILFGAAGIILGPIALTITISLLEIWFGRNSEELAGT
jgi:predicted PurR-regulated permease PerM